MNAKLFFTSILILSAPLNGVAQQITFQKSIGGSQIDYAYDAHKVVNGSGYVLGGPTASFPTQGIVNSYVVRSDGNGDTLWTASWGGTGGSCDQQYVNDLCPLSDGGVLSVGGKSVCSDTTNGGNIARLDANGNIIWAKYMSKYADPYPCIQSSDGNFIVGGYEAITGGVFSKKEAFLVKLDATTGDTLWSRTYGGTAGNEWFYHILQTSDGGYLSAGFAESFGQGGKDIYLVKTDANGNLQWSKTYGTTQPDERAFGHCLEATSDGGYILAGQGDNGAPSSRGIFLMKITSSGSMSWAKYYDGKFGHGVKPTPDGGFVISGGSVNGALLIKTNSGGNIIWTKEYTSVGSQWVELANDGGYVTGGSGNGSPTDIYIVKTDSMGNSGCNETTPVINVTAAPFIEINPPTQVTVGGKTVSYPFLFKRGGTANTFCSTVDINENENENDVLIFPNPSLGKFTVQAKLNSEISVYNLYGEKILSEKINTEQTQIGLRNHSNGIYFLQISSAEKTQTIKIILQK